LAAADYVEMRQAARAPRLREINGRSTRPVSDTETPARSASPVA
jgi:hypothetical protein